MFTERAARKIAPALLTCAALCFFLPFLGLSLATSDKAVGASATCDSGVLAYSGFDMIDGRAPSLNRDCGVNGAAAGERRTRSTSGSERGQLQRSFSFFWESRLVQRAFLAGRSSQ